MNEIIQLDEEYQQLIAKMSEKTVIIMQKFFERNPNAIAISYSQYTPYFNDGESCEWSIDGPSILQRSNESEDMKTLEKEIENIYEDNCFYTDFYDIIGQNRNDTAEYLKNNVDSYSWNHNKLQISNEDQNLIFTDLLKILQNEQIALSIVNNEHAHVLIMRDRIISFEYEHE